MLAVDAAELDLGGSVATTVTEALLAELERSIGATVVMGAVSDTAVVRGITVGTVLVAVAIIKVELQVRMWVRAVKRLPILFWQLVCPSHPLYLKWRLY